jgi:hypothetical protein
MSERNCGNCQFVHEEGVNKETLRKNLSCRRYPPVPQIIPSPNGPVTAGSFPPTQEHLYCGEWAPSTVILSAASN